MMKKIVMVMLLPTTLVANAYAGTVSDSLRTTLYYRSGYSLLELSYMDNAAKLETLKQGIRSIGDNPNTVLQHIKILSAASPEGNSKLNKRLARRRGERLRDYLKEMLESARQRLHGLLRRRRLGRTRPEDTERKCAVEPKALYIIRNTPEWIVRNGKVVDGRKRQLQNLDGGKAWKYMLANHFDSLRSGALVVCEIRHIVPSVTTDTLTLIQNQQGRLNRSSSRSLPGTASRIQSIPAPDSPSANAKPKPKMSDRASGRSPTTP